LGLSVEYRDGTSEVGKWLRYVFELLFIDSNEVGNIYVFTLAAIMPLENEKLLLLLLLYMINYF